MQVKLLLVKIFTWMADCIIACSFGFPQIPKFRHTRILTWTVGRVLAYEVWPSLSQTHQRVRAPMQQNLLSVQNFHHSGFRSSSHMRVINHNWSATKQHLHLQSVAEISRHSVLSGNRIRQVRHRLGLDTRTQISVCKSPFPSAGTAVSLFCAKTVQ